MEGAWNLQDALSSRNLDLFVLFSSLSGAVGQRGQTDYSAANVFLDSFVRYRQSLGQPASSVAIGVVEDAGYLTENPELMERIRALRAYTLREQDLLDALQMAMTKCMALPPTAAGYCNPAQTVIGLRSPQLLSDPSNRTIWRRDARMSRYRNLEAATASRGGESNDDFKQFLATVTKLPSMLNDQSSLGFIAHQLKKLLCTLMLLSEEDIDVRQSLPAFGVDSLVAIEIRKWWRQSLGLETSVLEIMNSGSFEQLGKNAYEGLQRKYDVVARNDPEAFLQTKAP